MAVDELSLLLECSFGGVAFPILSLGFDVNQDVIQHKRMDRNGARLENTGLGAISYSIKALFSSTVARGPNETWDNLYPDQKNKLLERLTDRSTQEFIHPELGSRNCKCTSIKESLDPNFRNGVTIDFTLVEDSGDDDAVDILQNATTAAIAESAANLDAVLGTLNPPIDTGLSEIGYDSFTDAINKITKVFDKIQLLQQQQLGKIDAIIGKINNLSFKVSNPILTFKNNQDVLIASLLQFKLTALNTTQSIGYHQTLSKTTFTSLSIKLQNSVNNLTSLNPSLVRHPTIPSFTIIKYYK